MIKSNERLAFLIELTQSEPNDPFGWYGLALEYQKSDLEKALEIYRKLISDFEDYLPSYYQMGLILGEMEQFATALEVLEKGIEKAMLHNDIHTLRELKNLRQNISLEL